MTSSDQSFSTQRDLNESPIQHHNQPAVLNSIASNSNNHLQQWHVPSSNTVFSSSEPFSFVQVPPLSTQFSAYSTGVVENPKSCNYMSLPSHNNAYQNASQFQSVHVGDTSHHFVNPNQMHQLFLGENNFLSSNDSVDGKEQQVKWSMHLGGQTSTPRKKSHQWTQEEDSVLKSLVNLYGVKNWAEIAKFMTGRMGKQCRERWINYLRPNIWIKKEWTAEEEEKFVDAHKKLGNKWTTISTKLHGRTENEIKNHWNAIKRKQAGKRKSKGTDSSTPLAKYIRSLTPAAPAAANFADVISGKLPITDDNEVNADPVEHENAGFNFEEFDESTYASKDIFAEDFSVEMNYSLFP